MVKLSYTTTYAMYALILVRLPIFSLLPIENLFKMCTRVRLYGMFLTRTEGVYVLRQPLSNVKRMSRNKCNLSWL